MLQDTIEHLYHSACRFHFQPPDGYFGDPIPFFAQGEYHVIYLRGSFYDPDRVSYTPYCHIVSADLVHWRELPLALPLGAPDDVDMSLGTGTVIEKNGLYHLFYCGRVIRTLPTNLETVCHATSRDLIHWQKDPANPLFRPDEALYTGGDFRDPSVFWNEQDRCYWMLISTRSAHSQLERRAVLALATSPDLVHWQQHPPIWDTSSDCLPPECPDMFQMNSRWYCTYNTWGYGTRYRIAESSVGTWQTPSLDTLDGGISYAAKTLYDGQRRFLIGWIGTRRDLADNGAMQWGGVMTLPREMWAQPDGTLGLRCPAEILQQFVLAPLRLRACTGSWQENREDWNGQRGGLALAFAEFPMAGLLQMKVKLHGSTLSAGILFRADGDLKRCYCLRLQRYHSRVTLERWPSQFDQGHALLCERPLPDMAERPVNIQLFLDGSVVEIFVDDWAVISNRLYDLSTGNVVLFVEQGEATFISPRWAEYTPVT